MVVFTTGVVDAVWDGVDSERPDGTLQIAGLDVVEAGHRWCVGVPIAHPHSVCC